MVCSYQSVIIMHKQERSLTQWINKIIWYYFGQLFYFYQILHGIYLVVGFVLRFHLGLYQNFRLFIFMNANTAE